MDKIKVLMLAGGGESTSLMFNGISDSFDVCKVIIESPVSNKQLLKRRARTLGIVKVFGQLCFMAYNKTLLKRLSLKQIIEIKRNKNLDDKDIDEKLITRVNSVNSTKTIDILKRIQPDIVIVNGSRIIKREILESIDAPFINTHVGITPKYRGVHGGYWALTENDIDNCGVTIHMIDTGIDTGGILYQEAIQVTNKDNFNTYPYLQIAAAIPLMKQAIKDLANNSISLQEVKLTSRLWSHPTLLDYFKNRILNGVK